MYGIIGCKLNGRYSILGDGEYADCDKMAKSLSEILEKQFGADKVTVKAVTLTEERYEEIRGDARLVEKELSTSM